MAVHDEIDCDGYSGSAAPFVTQVQVSVDGKVVATHTHSATDDGPWWSFDGALSIVGRQTVTITDRTAGNDYHGEPDNLHRVVELDCPVPTTTQVALTTVPHNPSSEPEALITIPVPVSVVEPTVPQSPATTVELSTVSPSTTTFQGMDEFHWSSPTTTVWGPCFEDGSCLPPPSTVMEATTVQPVLAVTGANYVPQMVGAGAALVLCGLVLRRNAKRPALR